MENASQTDVISKYDMNTLLRTNFKLNVHYHLQTIHSIAMFFG